MSQHLPGGYRRVHLTGIHVLATRQTGLGPFVAVAATLNSTASEMAKLVDGFKDGRPELGRRTFLVPENHAEVLALLYHEQTGIVGGLPVGPVTTDPFGSHGIRMYPDQDPIVLEETRRYFEKLAERFSNDLPKA
jgi:hypothetical protein